MLKALLMSCIIICCLVVVPTAAGHGWAKDSAAAQPTRLVIKNSQHAAKIVKLRYGGKVLKANKKTINGRVVYRVKILKKDGRIVSVQVDGHNGRVF